MGKTIRVADGDVFLNSAGRTESIEGVDKSAQDLAEMLMTPYDPERDYGSELADLDVPSSVSVFVGKSLIGKKVDEAVQRLKRMQEQDPYAGADEVIDRVQRLVIKEIQTGDYIFWVGVVTVSGKPIGDRVLAVSLRHQESARLVESVEELAARL